MNTVTGAPTETDSLLTEAATWLWSSEGRHAANRLLRQYRVRGADAVQSTDDLLAMALERFWRRLRRNSTPLEDVHLPAYLTSVMRNVLNDAWRGSRSSDVACGDLDDEAGPLIADSPVAPASESLPRAMRNRIETLDGDDWTKAAALVYLTLIGDPDAMTTDVPVPRPRGGATETEAAMWIALWIAGRSEEHTLNSSHT